MRAARVSIFFILCAAVSIGPLTLGAQESTIHAFRARSIRGEEVGLDRYRGRVVLVVNTASKCGFTYQFAGLQRLWETYRNAGLVVLGFPSDDFAGQEFASDAETLAFCTGEYDVSFPMFSQVDVTGDGRHPLFDYLAGDEAVSWNFNKFLVDRDGRLIARFGPRVEPDSPRMVAAVEAALADQAGGLPQDSAAPPGVPERG